MSLKVNGARVGRASDEVDEFRVSRIAHVQDREAVAEGLADIGIAAMHDDLNAIAAARLVGMAHELDVAGCDGRHREAPHSLPGWARDQAGCPARRRCAEDQRKAAPRQGPTSGLAAAK